MNPLPSVLDVASLLKQFMRELPIPLIPTHFHAPLEQAHSKVVDIFGGSIPLKRNVPDIKFCVRLCLIFSLKPRPEMQQISYPVQSYAAAPQN